MFKSERDRAAYEAEIKKCQASGVGKIMLRDVRDEYKCCSMCKAYRCAIIGRNMK